MEDRVRYVINYLKMWGCGMTPSPPPSLSEPVLSYLLPIPILIKYGKRGRRSRQVQLSSQKDGVGSRNAPHLQIVSKVNNYCTIFLVSLPLVSL